MKNKCQGCPMKEAVVKMNKTACKGCKMKCHNRCQGGCKAKCQGCKGCK